MIHDEENAEVHEGHHAQGANARSMYEEQA